MKTILRRAGAAGLAILLAAGAGGCATSSSFGESDFVRLRSANLFSVRYEANRQVLTVVRPDGDVYDYEGVPPDVYDGLMKAASKDEFFDGLIRERFKATKLDI